MRTLNLPLGLKFYHYQSKYLYPQIKLSTPAPYQSGASCHYNSVIFFKSVCLFSENYKLNQGRPHMSITKRLKYISKQNGPTQSQ